MANNEMLWRKLPIGIIRDEDMDLIADQLPRELRAAPYMFYLTALCKADNDGIFDLEDGVIFARLMRIGTPEDVFTIANLMMKRKIILRAGETTRCILTAWNYPKLEKPRTLEDRRAVVAKQIEEEKRNIIDVEFKVKDASANLEPPVFFGPKNDKKQENVVMDFFDDKNTKNVVQNIQTEREKERIEREREETHTEQKDKTETEKLALQAFDVALRASTKEYSEEIPEAKNEEQTLQREDPGITEPNTLAEQANEWENEEGGESKNGSFEAVSEALTNFFTKNCLGFNKAMNQEELHALTNRILSLGNKRNPPEIVVGVLLGCFQKLTEDKGYWQGMPLTPQQLLKPGTYAHVLNQTNKILNASQVNEAWISEEKKYAEQAAKDQEAVGNSFDNEYLKYGISPSDPNKVRLLMQAKANESKETDPP